MLKCDECGTEEDVVVLTKYWTCGGNNCFHFRWDEYENQNLPLCQECESNRFSSCDACGAFIDSDCLFGAEAFDDEGESIGFRCPACGNIFLE